MIFDTVNNMRSRIETIKGITKEETILEQWTAMFKTPIKSVQVDDNRDKLKFDKEPDGKVEVNMFNNKGMYKNENKIVNLFDLNVLLSIGEKNYKI